MKHQTHSSNAFRKRNISETIHPSFPGEPSDQPAHLGSQSAAPDQMDDGNSSLAPTQDMSFGRGY